jgi:hypothetical protein
MPIPDFVAEITSDPVLFPSLQIVLLLVVFLALFMDFWVFLRVGRRGRTIAVSRGEKSMSLFYGIYAALSGLFIAICLSVDTAKGYRVFWAIVDTILIAYLCIFNPWFRNVLLGWAAWLTKIEER